MMATDWNNTVGSIHSSERIQVKDVTSQWIRDHLIGLRKTVENGAVLEVPKIQHPAKTYDYLFSEEEPDIAATYQWSIGLDEECGLLSYVRDQSDDLKIWLDVLFIDQLKVRMFL